MAKTDPETTRELYRLLDEYIKVCHANLGTPDSWDSYIRYAGYFVRWADDKFTPGARRRRR